MTQIQECQQNGVFAFISRRLEALKRARPVVLRLKSLLNGEPNLACPARTPFLGEAIEGHPNRLDAEVALKIVFGVVSDRSGSSPCYLSGSKDLDQNRQQGLVGVGSSLQLLGGAPARRRIVASVFLSTDMIGLAVSRRPDGGGHRVPDRAILAARFGGGRQVD